MRGLKFKQHAYPVITLTSHPSRVRGLKYFADALLYGNSNVAPFTGAWIEIVSVVSAGLAGASRTLHGCVD